MRVQSAASKFPPRARLAFRVGIVGHRPNRLPSDKATLDQLQHMIGRVAEIVASKVADFATADRAAAQPLYAPEAPLVRAISPLAEGTDRMFAEEAIRLGYELLCPMPFHQEEFEKDFLPPDALIENSRDQFRDLLRRAGERGGVIKYELDGQRSASGDAYGMAGRVVLNQSDLLVVVWDRGLPKGGGGTVETLHEAVQFHVPVLWIDAMQPQEWRLLLREDDVSRVINRQPAPNRDLYMKSMEAQIEWIVSAELDSPRILPGQNQVTQLSAPEYFAETRPKRNFWFVWKMFRDLAGNSRLTAPKIAMADFETQVSGDWPIEPAARRASDPAAAASPGQPALTPPQMEHWVNRRLRPHYAWADKLADWYADHYRSAYISIYILSALGVLISLWGHRAWWSAWFEAACVGIIVVLVIHGGNRHWHERWMEYRLLAELIRQIRIKIPLGGGRPLPRTLIPGIYEDLSETWMYWHMRAVARATGVPAARVDRQYLLSCLGYVERLVDGQLGFHQTTMKRSERIAELLHSIASNLFLVSLCFIGVRLVTMAAVHWYPGAANFLPVPLSLLILAVALVLHAGRVFLVLATFLTALVAALSFESFESVTDLFLVMAVLPAFGAAFTGIANQGEFVRLEKRSIAMAGAFSQFKLRLAELRSRIETEPTTTSMMSNVITLATEITQAMVDEVSDWRVVVAEQPMRW